VDRRRAVVDHHVTVAKLDPKGADYWIPRDVYAGYLGEGSDALLKHYDKAKRKRNTNTMSFDLFAMLAFPAWLGYRRQWPLWTVYVGTFGLLPFAERLGGFEFSIGAFAGVGFAMGLMARGFVLSVATVRYFRLKSQGLAAESIRAALQGLARRSPPLAVAGGFGALAAFVSLELLASVILD
jgi:hypothetical protein